MKAEEVKNMVKTGSRRGAGKRLKALCRHGRFQE